MIIGNCNDHRYERTLDKNIDTHVSYNFSSLFDREQCILVDHKSENHCFRRPTEALMRCSVRFDPLNQSLMSSVHSVKLSERDHRTVFNRKIK